MGRWLLLVAGILLCCLSTGIWLITPEHGINRVTFDRIVNGMTQQEVECLIGLPPGDHISAGNPNDRSIFFLLRLIDSDGAVVWRGDEGTIRVWFDESGKVYHADFDDAWVTPEPLVDKLRRRLGL